MRKTYKFHARAENQETLDTIWCEARKAHELYNALITAHHDRLQKRWEAEPLTGEEIRWKARKKLLGEIKKRTQSALNSEHGKKTRLPKEWRARYKVVNDKINDRIKAAKRQDPVFEAVQEKLSVLRKERGGKVRLPDVEQQEYNRKLLKVAKEHPISLSRVELELKAKEDSADLYIRSGIHASTRDLITSAVGRAIKSGWHRARYRSWRHRDSHRVGLGDISNNGSQYDISRLNLTPIENGWGTHILTFADTQNLRIKMHRKLPEGAVINMMWVQLVRREARFPKKWHKHGGLARSTYKWDLEVCIAITIPDITNPPTNRDSVGIDIGYRKVFNDEGEVMFLRSGSLSDETHLDTPKKARYLMGKARELDGLADRMIEDYWSANRKPTKWTTRQKLADMRKREFRDSPIGGMGRGIAGVKWKSGDRSFAAFDAQYRHLKQWATCCRQKSLRVRNEHYRQTAAHICKKYSHIVIEDINYASMAKGQIAGSNRFEVAPSSFLSALKNAAQNYGSKIEKVPAAYTSQTCNACSHVDPKAREGEVYNCSKCGYHAHADINAAKNILASGSVTSETP